MLHQASLRRVCKPPFPSLACLHLFSPSHLSRFIAGADGRLALGAFYKKLSASQQLPLSMGIMNLTMQEATHDVPSQLKILGQLSVAIPVTGQQTDRLQQELPQLGGEGTMNESSRADPLQPWPTTTRFERWAVCNSIGGGVARTMALTAHAETSGRLVPWVGVAAPLSLSDPLPAAGVLSDTLVAQTGAAVNSSTPKKETTGRVFCFLPLPIYSSLPVHVNGYFELSSNRRDIW